MQIFSRKSTVKTIIIARFTHISMDQLLQDEINSNSSVANEIKQSLNENQAVPDEIVLNIVKETMKACDSSK